MMAPQTSQEYISPDLNLLRPGSGFCVTTQDGSVAGEYLGMETLHGDRAILLRHRAGTESILVFDVTVIEEWADRTSIDAVA
jgi:hypothetical protein